MKKLFSILTIFLVSLNSFAQKKTQPEVEMLAQGTKTSLRG